MAQTIKLKRSATQGAVPSTSALALGEIAINTYDGKLFIKKNDGSESIVTIGTLENNAVTSAKIAANAVTSSEVAANAIGASEIASNSVGISELNVSDGTTGQVLTTDGSGNLSFSSKTATAQSFYLNTATGNGSTTDFTLSTTPAGESYIIAFIDGVFQNQDSYTFSGTTLSFDTAPANGTTVTVYVVGSIYSGNSVVLNTFSGDNSTVAFTLSENPQSENNTQVYIDGVYQQKSEYSVSGTTLTFSSAPPTGTNNIEVIAFSSTNFSVLNANSVTSASIASGAVNTSDIADNAITSAKIASGVIVASDVADNSITSAKIAKNAVGSSEIAALTADLSFGDSVKAIFGADSDLELYHSGTHGFLTNTTGDLYIQDTNGSIRIRPKTGESGIDVLADGAVNLYYDNAKKLATTSTGIDVTGDVSIGDGSSTATRFIMGTDDDSKMFHNGVDSYWINDTGNIIIRNQSDDKDIYLQTDDGLGGTTTYITVDGSETDVSLHYGGSQKLATTSTGINVTGTVTSDGLVVDGLSTLSSNNNATPLSIVRASATSDQTGISFNAGGNTRYIGKGTDDEPYWATSANLSAGSKIVTSGNFTGILDSTYYQSGDDISVGNITATGYLRGPSTFTIDPATHGDDTGTVVIAGNLQVDGTTTTINSTTLTVDDKLITLASGSINAAAADGAGIEVDITGSTNPSLTYDGTNDEWDFNKRINVTGTGNEVISINSSANGAQINFNSATSSTDWIVGIANDATDDYIIYQSGIGTGDIRLYTDGLERLTVLHGGNVGIGTASPAYPLHVWSDTTIARFGGTDTGDTYLNFFKDSAATIIKVQASKSGSGATDLSINPDGGNVGIGTDNPSAILDIRTAQNSTSQFTNPFIKLFPSSTTNTTGFTGITYGISTLDNYGWSAGGLRTSTSADVGAFVFNFHNNSASGSEKVRIDSSGNVAIGASTALDNRLEVNGGDIRVRGTSTPSLKLNNGDQEVVGMRLKSGASGVLSFHADKMVIDTSGNVGIGTTDPKSKLEVKGTFGAPATSGFASGFISRFSQTSGPGSLDVGFGDPYSWLQSRASNNYAVNYNLALNPNGGNVGIGTTSPSGKLDVRGVSNFGDQSNAIVYVSTPSSSEGRIGVGGRTSVVPIDMTFWTADGGANYERMRILSTGGITFNGDTAAANALDDYEEGTFTPSVGDGTYTYSNLRGHYVKIGNMVHIHIGFKINTASGIGTNNAAISGLPFTSASYGSYREPHERVGVAGLCATANLSYNLSFFVGNTDTALYARTSASNNDTPVASNAVWQNGTFIKLQMSYTVS